MRYTSLALALALLCGCGGGDPEKKETVRLEQVPANVMKVAKEQLPGVKFDQAWRKTNGSYEVRGKDRTGKVREIDVRPDGTVEEIE